MNREAFKQRMQNLKSYREQNPGKGYWDFKSYEDGGEVPATNKPTIIEPIPYKGKLYSDRYGRKYTEEQVQDYYNNGTDEIDRFTGGPLVRGLKPLLDLEDAANFTPVGDAVAAYDVYDAVSNRDWYFTQPTEQKAHMNQLREYMFNNGHISRRGQAVSPKMMKKVIEEVSNIDSMREVARASRQFNNINKYTRWFNAIPLLGLGAAAVYRGKEE